MKINMMSGKRNFGASWIHVDKADFPHIDETDVWLKKWADNCADLIYCSHGIAYWPFSDAPELLQSWHRVLKPGGIIRLATPEWEKIRQIADVRKVRGPIFGEMFSGDELIYHKVIYSYELLESILIRIGFADIKRYNHWETEHHNTGDRGDPFDDCSAAYYNGVLISLNIQAKKPNI